MDSSKTFLIDEIEGLQISYSTLFNILNQPVHQFSKCIIHNTVKDYFIDLLKSLVCDEPVCIIDGNIPKNELIKHYGLNEFDFQPKSFTTKIFSKDIQSLIYNTGYLENHSVTIITSGTTGIPKRMAHSLKSLLRSVKIDKRHQNNIWGFAFNPAHMAGIQVLLQSFFNENSLINIFNQDCSLIHSQIEKYNISHISATPTFYRHLFQQGFHHQSVKQITSGGELIDKTLLYQLKILFPQARFTNVYASTEGGYLLSSSSDFFEIREEQHQNFRIVDDVLHVHNSLISTDAVKDVYGEWYNTNDLVEIISTTPIVFRFIGRKDEVINVGGLKVDPSEVENLMLEIEGITDVCVYGRKNSVTGRILCCDVVASNPNLSEYDIKFFLSNKIQDYKIPRLVNFVSEINKTRNIKKSRIGNN